MNKPDLGQQLRAERKTRKLTLKELANRSGVHFVTLSRFENGLTDLGVRKLNRLARALGLEVTLRPQQQSYTLDDLATGALSTSEGNAKSQSSQPSVFQKTKSIRK